MTKPVLQTIVLVISTLGMSTLTGCNGSIDPHAAIANANKTNIQRLANLYFSFQMKNNWLGPADEAEFKEFLREFSPKKLARIGVDPGQTEDLFISERDGQSFEIRFSVLGSAMGSSEPVIFESEGVDGKRQVGFLNMQLREVEAAEYDDLWNGKIQATKHSRDLPINH